MLIPMRGRRNGGGPDDEYHEEARLGVDFLGIPTYRQSLRVLHAELRRARRYQHPLSVAVLSPAGVTLEAPRVELVRAPHLSFYLLGSLLRDVLRETDVATYAAEHHLFAVFMLETREAEALRAVDRLRGLFHGRTGARVRAGIAEFPRDGLTMEDVFAAARLAWEERPRLTPREVDAPQEVKNA
jgi:hypothetical protein